jgi:hypothetical protein
MLRALGKSELPKHHASRIGKERRVALALKWCRPHRLLHFLHWTFRKACRLNPIRRDHHESSRAPCAGSAESNVAAHFHARTASAQLSLAANVLQAHAANDSLSGSFWTVFNSTKNFFVRTASPSSPCILLQLLAPPLHLTMIVFLRGLVEMTSLCTYMPRWAGQAGLGADSGSAEMSGRPLNMWLVSLVVLFPALTKRPRRWMRMKRVMAIAVATRNRTRRSRPLPWPTTTSSSVPPWQAFIYLPHTRDRRRYLSCGRFTWTTSIHYSRSPIRPLCRIASSMLLAMWPTSFHHWRL